MFPCDISSPKSRNRILPRRFPRARTAAGTARVARTALPQQGAGMERSEAHVGSRISPRSCGLRVYTVCGALHSRMLVLSAKGLSIRPLLMLSLDRVVLGH